MCFEIVKKGMMVEEAEAMKVFFLSKKEKRERIKKWIIEEKLKFWNFGFQSFRYKTKSSETRISKFQEKNLKFWNFEIHIQSFRKKI